MSKNPEEQRDDWRQGRVGRYFKSWYAAPYGEVTPDAVEEFNSFSHDAAELISKGRDLDNVKKH